MGRPKGSKNKLKLNKTLMELAQDLVTYCIENGSNSNVELELTLPQSVLESVSKALMPVDATIVLKETDTSTQNLLRTFFVNGGTVKLKSSNLQGTL